jgi:hypothetical protein
VGPGKGGIVKVGNGAAKGGAVVKSAKALTQSICEEVLSGLRESCKQLLLDGEDEPLHQQEGSQPEGKEQQYKEQLPELSGGYEVGCGMVTAPLAVGQSNTPVNEHRVLLLASLSKLARQLNSDCSSREGGILIGVVPKAGPAAAGNEADLAGPTLASIAAALKAVVVSSSPRAAGDMGEGKGQGMGVQMMMPSSVEGRGLLCRVSGDVTGEGGQGGEGRMEQGLLHEGNLVQGFRGTACSRGEGGKLQGVVEGGVEGGQGTSLTAATGGGNGAAGGVAARLGATAAASGVATAEEAAAAAQGGKGVAAAEDVLLFQQGSTPLAKQQEHKQHHQHQQQQQMMNDAPGQVEVKESSIEGEGGTDSLQKVEVNGCKRAMQQNLAVAVDASDGGFDAQPLQQAATAAATRDLIHAAGVIEAQLPASPNKGEVAIAKGGDLQHARNEVLSLPLKRRWRLEQARAAAGIDTAAAVRAEEGLGTVLHQSQQHQQEVKQHEEQGEGELEEGEGLRPKKLQKQEQGQGLGGDEIMTDVEYHGIQSQQLQPHHQQQQQEEFEEMKLDDLHGPAEVRRYGVCLSSVAYRSWHCIKCQMHLKICIGLWRSVGVLTVTNSTCLYSFHCSCFT